MSCIDAIIRWLRPALVAAALFSSFVKPGRGGTNQPAVSPLNSNSTASVQLATSTASAPAQDLAAQKFLTTCAGCHSLTGVKMTGPDLAPVGAWPADQLKLAIKKMEPKVGPLAEADLALLGDLLRDAKVRERLKAAEARIAEMFMAKLDPPNPITGKALIFGRAALRNGGLACVACHAVDGQGGNLGPDLTGSFAKLGELPLISAIEQSNFKIMGPHYRLHPVTRQEAMHLARYLSTLNGKPIRPPPVSFAAWGAGGGLAAFASLLVLFRKTAMARQGTLQRRRK